MLPYYDQSGSNIHSQSQDYDDSSSDVDSLSSLFGRGSDPAPLENDSDDELEVHMHLINNAPIITRTHRPQPSHIFVRSSCRITSLRTKAGGFTGKIAGDKKIKGNKPEPKTLQEALDMGLTLVKSHQINDTVILDADDRIVAVISARHKSTHHDNQANDAFKVLSDAWMTTPFHKTESKHKRGTTFVPINGGLSYGNGHVSPTILKPKAEHAKVIDGVLNSPAFQYISSHQNSLYESWHPNAYALYKRELYRLLLERPDLGQPSFQDSALPSFTVNIGSNVFTSKHTDTQNFPFGWCTITALGNFDYTEGGHLILWDLNIILEFPAGSCACIPSALVSHSNLPVSSTERRMSFAQYCGGEIFRYIENGFITDKDLLAKDKVVYNLLAEERSNRAHTGYDMFLVYNGAM